MMEFEHAGIKITMDSGGEFTARDKTGKLVRKPSLKAMKAHLDKQAKSEFTPFKALTTARVADGVKIPGTDLVRTEVVGVTKSLGYGSRRDPKLVFLTKHSALSSYELVLRDCSEAIEAHKKMRAYEEETKRIDMERHEGRAKLADVVDKFRLDPNTPDYKPTEDES